MESSQIIEHQGGIGNAPLQFHNSRLPVNRVCADILYKIFVSAVHESLAPVQTSLSISHVCRHWRKSALEWPALWGFINLNTIRPNVDLFMNRSGNAPLALSWTWDNWWRLSWGHGWPISNPNNVSPRLYSLTLHISPSQFNLLRNVLLNPDVPPLRLRHLDIKLLHDSPNERSTPTTPPRLMDLVRVDPSCLQELELCLVDLPWLELPYNKLTHFKLCCPTNPPTLSHLLRFLSSCPLLRELELEFANIGRDMVDITDSRTILDLPKLERLTLMSSDVASYTYIQEISARIRNVSSLSKFELFYDNRIDGDPTLPMSPDTTTLNVFEIVPSGVLSNFRDHRFLHVDIPTNPLGCFGICSAPERICPRGIDAPFHVQGTTPLKGPNTLDMNRFTPIQEMVRAMPGVTFLELAHLAWQLPWIADIPRLLPHLDTLHLCPWERDIDVVLNSLPEGLKLRKLILTNARVNSVDVLVDVVLKAGVQVLELHTEFIEMAQAKMMQMALRQRGVVVGIKILSADEIMRL